MSYQSGDPRQSIGLAPPTHDGGGRRTTSFSTYTRACAVEIRTNRAWNEGQIRWNLLADYRPDIAELLSGSEADCWLNGLAIEPFIEKVEALW